MVGGRAKAALDDAPLTIDRNCPKPRASGIVHVRMRRYSLALAFTSALTSLGLALISPSALAAQKTSELVKELKSDDDYRVRTQAALALGASGDDAAVKPLCDALGDSNASVRVASAAALGKLGKPAGLPCLESASKKESSASVKAQIDKSMSALQSAGSGSSGGGPAAPPPPSADTKFYVAIQVTNKTARSADEVDAIVRSAMQSKILMKKGYAVAPKTETVTQGGQIVKQKKLKGFYLLATVESPDYAGGNLTQVVHVSMMTYPGKVLQGEFTPKLTQEGTPAKDVASEKVLMQMCAENAVDTFQKVAASL